MHKYKVSVPEFTIKSKKYNVNNITCSHWLNYIIIYSVKFRWSRWDNYIYIDV